MAGYTRQSLADIQDGEDIVAGPLNDEFDALQSAFNGTTGHSHDGTTGNSPKIELTAAAAVNGILPLANGGTGSSTASGARTNLGLAIGTNVQAYDAGLQSISGLTTAADTMIYTTALDAYATTALTPFARTVLDDTTAGAALTTLGVSAFGQSLIDDATSGAARNTLGLVSIASSGSASDLTTGTINDARLPTTMSAKNFTGSLGVGNATPGGSFLNNGKAIAIGDGDTGIRQNVDGQLQIVTNNTVRATFDTSNWFAGTIYSDGVSVVLNNSGTYNLNITGNSATTTLATKASTLAQNGGNGTAMTFNWSGQGGQPSWLWGSNDGSNMLVWSPSNFSVNNAANLGGVAASSYVKNDGNTYSIHITGNAGTCTTASNSNALGGIAAASYLTTSDLKFAMASIAYNDIGVTVMARRTSAAAVAQGDDVAGSTLVFSNADGSQSSPALSGTYECLGRTTGTVGAAAVSCFRKIGA